MVCEALKSGPMYISICHTPSDIEAPRPWRRPCVGDLFTWGMLVRIVWGTERLCQRVYFIMTAATHPESSHQAWKLVVSAVIVSITYQPTIATPHPCYVRTKKSGSGDRTRNESSDYCGLAMCCTNETQFIVNVKRLGRMPNYSLLLEI